MAVVLKGRGELEKKEEGMVGRTGEGGIVFFLFYFDLCVCACVSSPHRLSPNHYATVERRHSGTAGRY